MWVNRRDSAEVLPCIVTTFVRDGGSLRRKEVVMRLRSLILSIAGGGLLLAAAPALAPAPAFADGWHRGGGWGHHDEWRGHGWRGHGWGWRPRYYGPPVVVAPYAYGRYYAPPPVYYPPPAYYAPPGVSFGFTVR
jgi:hypothetical protein